MARNLVVGLAGAIGAVVIATLLSPIAPLGEARLAEDTTGITFDSLVLLLGALATVAVVLALGIWPALRAARTRRSDEQRRVPLLGGGAAPGHPGRAAHHGDRRPQRPGAPLRAYRRSSGSALLGMVLAVIALCATGVFGASLTNLTATPRLYGDPEQLGFNPANTVLFTSLEHNPAVTAITEGVGRGGRHGQREVVGAIAGTSVKGPLLFSTVAGTLPVGDDQVGLGVSTMRQVGAHIGSVVDITFTTHRAPPTPSRTGSSPRSPSRSSGGS